MTEQEWEKLEKLFSGSYGYAKLDCDGYKLTLEIKNMGNLQLIIFPYVNGEFKGRWQTNDCEERRRFFQKKESFLFSKKTREGLKKQLGKNLYDRSRIKNEKYSSYSPFWKSFRKLKAHLIANNKEIKLVKLV